MNYYLFSFIVILCFGPSAAAREVYLHPNRTSAGATEETKIKLSDDTKSPIINALVQVVSKTKIWAHWFRRILKTLRKWCNAHPPEVKLGKCFVSYFNVKIPGLRRYDKNVHRNVFKCYCFGSMIRILAQELWSCKKRIFNSED